MFGSRRHTPDQKELAAWVCMSGLHCLRMGTPEKAEHDFAQEMYREGTLRSMIARGEISPSATYNVVRQSAWGIARSITVMPVEGAGRTWPGAVPQEFASLPTIQVPEVEIGSTHHVRDIVNTFTTVLDAQLRDIFQRNMADIEEESQPDVSVSDLNVFAPQPTSALAAILLRRQTDALINLLDSIASLYENPSDVDGSTIDDCWQDRAKRYGHTLMDGYSYAAFLVAIELIRRAYPAWPFRSGAPRFVCGRLQCAHHLCRLWRDHIHQSIPLPAIFGASIGVREVWSFFSRNRVSLDSFIRSALAEPLGQQWLRHVAEQLYLQAKTLWETIHDASTVTNFYYRHFLNVGFSQAALLACGKVAGFEGDAWEQSPAAYKAKEMEESVARSGAALWFDFRNSVSLSRKHPRLSRICADSRSIAFVADEVIDNYRVMYAATAQKSTTAAEINLDKWIYNEAMFPVFWQDFVRGKTDTLPLKPEDKGTGGDDSAKAARV